MYDSVSLEKAKEYTDNLAVAEERTVEVEGYGPVDEHEAIVNVTDNRVAAIPTSGRYRGFFQSLVLYPSGEVQRRVLVKLAKEVREGESDLAMDFYPGKPSEDRFPELTIIMPNPSKEMEKEIEDDLEIEVAEVSIESPKSIFDRKKLRGLELALSSSEDAGRFWESIPEESWIVIGNAAKMEIRKKFKEEIKKSKNDFGAIVDPSHRSVFVVAKKGKEEIEDFKHPSVEMSLIG